jgi:hypothetical protein
MFTVLPFRIISPLSDSRLTFCVQHDLLSDSIEVVATSVMQQSNGNRVLSVEVQLSWLLIGNAVLLAV